MSFAFTPGCCCGGEVICCPIVDEYQRAESTSVGAAYTEEEGDWLIEEVTKTSFIFGTFTTTVLITDDVPATILFADTLPSGDAHSIDFWWGTRELLDRVSGLRFRYLWGWADDDNYWCVEYEFGEPGAMSYGLCGATDGPDAIRIIERVAGVETVHKEVLDLENRALTITGFDSMFGQPLPITTTEFSVADKRESVLVCPDGYVQVWFTDFSNPGTYFFTEGPFTFPDTGVTGFKVMEGSDGFLLQYVLRCIYSASCDVTCEALTEPCDGERDPGPDPDPIGCCTDFDDLVAGDAIEITVSGVTYFLISPCPAVCGDSAYLTALNATHTGVVAYKSDVHLILYADTGLTTDCNGLDVSAKIWIWITNIGGGECQARGELRFGENVCSILFEYTFSSPATCEGLVLAEDGAANASYGLEPRNCCLQADDATLTIAIP